jgi:O-antigen biosynthesis protein
MIRRLFRNSRQKEPAAPVVVDPPREPYFHVMSPFKSAPCASRRTRINLVLPSVHAEHLTGGPATLVNYLHAIAAAFPDFGFRLLPVMVPFDGDREALPPSLIDFEITSMVTEVLSDGAMLEREIVADSAYKQGILPVAVNDVFIATMWPTHFVCKALQRDQAAHFGRSHKLQYVIQDYEPAALFPWSELYLLAEQTYADIDDTIAIVATHSLHRYLVEQGHCYRSSYSFDPSGNTVALVAEIVEKSEVIIVYGRPGAPRNCFTLLIEALLRVTGEHPEVARRFRFISLGEAHPNYRLNHGAVLESGGFLSPDDYRSLLLSAAVGCFFVVSPHTGYVCLEMASHGLLTVSNSFRTKDVKALHPNIREPQAMNVDGVSNAIVEAVQDFWRDPGRGRRVALEHAALRQAEEIVTGFDFIGSLFREHYVFNSFGD